MDKYEPIRLKNQLCFPLYAVSNKIIRNYKPLLDKSDLTYTQYITMMVLWEHKSISVKKLGECLYLDSGTLTPLLKNLEKKNYVTRKRSKEDERVLDVTITEEGMALRDKALEIPEQLGNCLKISKDEVQALYSLLYKLL